MGKGCSVEGCQRIAVTRGYCEMHYRRVLRTGKPGPPGPLRSIAMCRVELCDKPVDAKGLCHGHYQRLLRNGAVGQTPLRKGIRMCSVEACDRKAKARGFCPAHYKRVLKHGDPLAEIPIKTSDGNGHMSHGYRLINIPPELRHLSRGATKIAEHRWVVATKLGRPLRHDEHVHHKNGVKTDNRLDNLELWSTHHPVGQRIEDLLEFAQTIIDRYGEEFGLLER